MTNSAIARQRALARECPYCHAKPGAVCITAYSSRGLALPHLLRSEPDVRAALARKEK